MFKRTIALPGGVLIGLATLLLSGSVWAIKLKATTIAKRRGPVSIGLGGQNVDPLMNKLILILQKEFPLQSECLVEGRITCYTQNKKKETLQVFPYIYSQKENEYYLRQGGIEEINSGGKNVTIHHRTKKILISPVKPLDGSIYVEGFRDLANHVDTEGYKLSSKVNGQTETITLLNENHATCKEYSITIDNSSNSLKRIFSRMTNQDNMRADDNDEIVDFIIIRSNKQSTIENYINRSVVSKKGSKWVAAEKYKGFDIVNMYK